MPRLLKDLRIQEVSSVNRGAGEGVKVLLMKRDVGDPAHPVSKGGETTMTDDEIKALVTKTATDTSVAAVAAATKPLSETIAKLERENRILKMSDAHKAYMDSCDDDTKKAFADLPDDKARDEFAAKKPIKKAEDVAKGADVMKLEGQLAQQGATIVSLTKRLDEQANVAKLAGFTERAKVLGATTAGDGELMMKAYSGDAEAAVRWDARLIEVNNALRKQAETGALFAEFGTARPAAGSAAATMIAKGEEIRKADPKLSEPQAYTKAFTDPANRELAQRVRQEERAGRQVAYTG